MTEIEYVSNGPGDWVLGKLDESEVWFILGDVPGCVALNEEEGTLEIVEGEYGYE